jgi:hypothetical protein
MGQILLGYGIIIGGVLLGALILGIVAGILTALCYTIILGWHAAVWVLQTPWRRRDRRLLEEHRWRTWRPTQDLRRLPH